MRRRNRRHRAHIYSDNRPTMRARRRRIFQRQDTNTILLEEFRFYNKNQQVINDSILQELQDRLKSDDITHLFWTSTYFAKYGIGFKLQKVHTEIGDENKKKIVTNIYIEILEFSYRFKETDFNTVKHIVNGLFISCDLTDDQVSLLEELKIPQNQLKNNRGYIATIFTTWSEIVDFLIESSALTTYEPQQYTEWESFNNDIELLFGKIPLSKPTYDIRKEKYSTLTIYHIFHVIEKRIHEKNYRISFETLIDDYYKKICIQCTADTDSDYTAIDTGRVAIKPKQLRYYVDLQLNEYTKEGAVIIYNDLFNSMTRHLDDILTTDRIITPTIYRFYKERIFKQEFVGYTRGLTDVEKQILDRYKILLEEGKTIKIGDVYISTHKIHIEDFTFEFSPTFLDVIGNLVDVKEAVNIENAQFNYNTIYENLLKLSKLKYVRMDCTHYNEYKQFGTERITVNTIDIIIRKGATRMAINNVFCRISDVTHVVSKAICYPNQQEFTRYVKDVSYIGIEWKKLISNGVTLELRNPCYNLFTKTGCNTIDKMYMRFSLLWDAQKRQTVYLLLNGKKYLIKYKGKFKRYFNYPHRSLTMADLKKELQECLETIDDTIIVTIVENAIEEANIVKERGKELVHMTVQDVHAKEEAIELQGNTIAGYIIVGRRTGAKYFIHKIDLSVWKWGNGSWNRRCIVDDSNKQRIFEDKLANRLINIYNEPQYLERFLKT